MYISHNDEEQIYHLIFAANSFYWTLLFFLV